ncbi:hypothetical protein KKG72_03225 [bacterium]|nr:hypothetical protein [bacterium]MBU1994198.1 hypothetical protein [bacterium]
MKFFLIFMILVHALLFAWENENSERERKSRIEKQIKIEMEKEKKYAKERTFYLNDEYDLKGAEVNKDSLSSLPDREVDDFDMDAIYD